MNAKFCAWGVSNMQHFLGGGRAFCSAVKILAIFVSGQMVIHDQMLVYLYEGGIFCIWEWWSKGQYGGGCSKQTKSGMGDQENAISCQGGGHEKCQFRQRGLENTNSTPLLILKGNISKGVYTGKQWVGGVHIILTGVYVGGATNSESEFRGAPNSEKRYTHAVSYSLLEPYLRMFYCLLFTCIIFTFKEGCIKF